MQNWYLIYTKPKSEEMVATKFLDSGFEVLNPKIRERKHVRGRFQERTSSLFPSYIFVRLDIFKHYRLVKYTRGVRKIVGTENVPTVVPAQIVHAILARMADGFINITAPEFAEGEPVNIDGGHLDGFEAIFEEPVKNSERVIVLLKTINARVVIDGALLKRANVG
ncbi:MAG: transcription termination/antitermination NusG family protein [Thermodesulfobacteriota bacterium]